MQKITKGLKKKKKGKKSKRKDEELFKPEELEAYRREHNHPTTVAATSGDEPSGPSSSSAAAAGSSSGQNEEWKKFIALTSGVDDILKKTQGDLDRIKSTSFFQRIPTKSETERKKRAEEQNQVVSVAEESLTAVSINKNQNSSKENQAQQHIGIVEVSESETDDDDEDDIFDTAYIDAIAAGDVKLAYIPESPTDEQIGDDPFDTSIAERAILGPVVERRGKKLVYIGSAVEVLTGRVQVPTCATRDPVSNRRQKVLQENNNDALLLDSFVGEEEQNSTVNAAISEPPQRTLLDDDAPLSLVNQPIDLSQNLHQSANLSGTNNDDDDEFALLAAESVSKVPVSFSQHTSVVPKIAENWAAFETNNTCETDHNEEETLREDNVEDDPFDTAFAENILPGKAELKLIENEILNNDNDFDPRAAVNDDQFSTVINKVSIKVTDPTGERESISSLDRISESDLNLIKPIHRDLLGGSNTDLSNLNDQPLRPAEQVDDVYIEYCDPFDTSIVDTATLPGHTELKFLEKELLGDLKRDSTTPIHISDDEFDPRREQDEIDKKERTLSRPDVLNFTPPKTVSFDISPVSVSTDLLNAVDDDEHCNIKVNKPLTPFYVRKQSIPSNVDPFDTSFVNDIAPGKAELKQIESELFDPNFDQDFDPRDERKVAVEKVVQTIKEIGNPVEQRPIKRKEEIDLFASDHDYSVKALTPALTQDYNAIDHELSYCDPFDTTSIATNILPGKTELKLIETELIHSSNSSGRVTDDLLIDSDDIIARKPLTPITKTSISSVSLSSEDIDPFDTTIANNIVPGKTELKLLESELI